MATRRFHLSTEQHVALRRIAEAPCEYVIGTDEVGMGSIAGPVTVAAVVLPRIWQHTSVKDSKKLTRRQHKIASDIVRQASACYCIFSATNEDIDREGLHKVHARLTEQAVLHCQQYFPDALIVQDGNDPVMIDNKPQRYMVWLPKADSLVPAVSAASVLAKYYRDAFMIEQHKYYPRYGFETNMGYGTPEHYAALHHHGKCPLHRMSIKGSQYW